MSKWPPQRTASYLETLVRKSAASVVIIIIVDHDNNSLSFVLFLAFSSPHATKRLSLSFGFSPLSLRRVGSCERQKLRGPQRHPHRHHGLHPARFLHRCRIQTDVGGVWVGKQGEPWGWWLIPTGFHTFIKPLEWNDKTHWKNHLFFVAGDGEHQHHRSEWLPPAYPQVHQHEMSDSGEGQCKIFHFFFRKEKIERGSVKGTCLKTSHYIYCLAILLPIGLYRSNKQMWILLVVHFSW